MSNTDQDYKTGLVVGRIEQLTAAAPGIPPDCKFGQMTVGPVIDYAAELARRDARIKELEETARNLLAVIDEIDTSSGEEIKGSIYYKARAALGL